MKIRVYYEDTDAGGVVYHSNYLKFCERARSELFFDKNIDIFDPKKGHFLMTKADCSFISSARLGDILELKSSLIELKKVSLKIKQTIFLKNKPCFEAIFTLAYLKDGKLAAIDLDLIAHLKELFSK